MFDSVSRGYWHGGVNYFVFPFYLNHQVVPYVILFIERDGSTYITSLLKTHPGIKAKYEIFSNLKQRGVDSAGQLEWARNFLKPPIIGRHGAIGFKTKLVDILDQKGFSNLLKDKNCHIIHMDRRNLIKAVASRINAQRLFEETGKWNLYNEVDRPPPMEFDIAQFDQFIKERETAVRELNEYVQNLQLPTLKIVYEDLLRNEEMILRDLFNFLNVRNFHVEGKPLKATKDDLREVIINFEDLKMHYANTIYEPMFDEVLITT